MLKKLVFLGCPGAGKGTVSAKLTKSISIVHISTGDIFRYNIKNKTELGLKVEAVLASGGLVDDELTNALVKDRLSQSDTENGFILDGYPRTIAQAEALKTFAKIDGVINFVLDEDEAIKRLSGRLTCGECGAGYHSVNKKSKVNGVCDVCSGSLVVRKDDTMEAISTRLKVYHENTAPLINYYTQNGLIKNIDAMQSPEKTMQEVLQVISE